MALTSLIAHTEYGSGGQLPRSIKNEFDAFLESGIRCSFIDGRGFMNFPQEPRAVWRRDRRRRLLCLLDSAVRSEAAHCLVAGSIRSLQRRCIRSERKRKIPFTQRRQWSLAVGRNGKAVLPEPFLNP